MALIGDLEHIHIVDIIQLIHTTRKSGTFSVKGNKGESRIIFSNGHIVGASHLNGRIRIGSVLVKMNAITKEDLEKALEVQKNAGKERKPLIYTLIKMGKLGHDEAFQGLKKLIEMTIVEIMNWTKGSFTFDTEAIAVSDELSYIPDKMEQDVSLDAQMVLMDALCIFDERERDRKAGKYVQPYEELFQEVISSERERDVEHIEESTVLTADDLGLANLEKLEEKTPKPFSFKDTKELFDPIEIHRQKIRETLADFSTGDQESFISFLKKSTKCINTHKEPPRIDEVAKTIILLSRDNLFKHSVMTICKYEGILVFAVEKEDELDSIIDQCILKNYLPILVIDYPESSENKHSEKNIIDVRHHIKRKYPNVSIIQLISLTDYTFTLQSFNDGILTVFPKPLKVARKETFIEDTIKFLEIFKRYILDILHEQKGLSLMNIQLSKLRDRMSAMRSLNEPSDVTFALLQFVSEIFERSITFIVRPTEIISKEAIGVKSEKIMGPTSITNIKIPLTEPSIFNDAVINGQCFYGQSDDVFLKEYIFKEIGSPLRPTVLLLPVKSNRKSIILTYGDFGIKESSPVQIEVLEILAHYAGLILENVLYRKHFKNKAFNK